MASSGVTVHCPATLVRSKRHGVLGSGGRHCQAPFLEAGHWHPNGRHGGDSGGRSFGLTDGHDRQRSASFRIAPESSVMCGRLQRASESGDSPLSNTPSRRERATLLSVAVPHALEKGVSAPNVVSEGGLGSGAERRQGATAAAASVISPAGSAKLSVSFPEAKC